MPRVIRFEYPGAIYYLTNRNDSHAPIYRDDADRLRFLLALAGNCAITGWRVHAFSLTPTHFRLVLETPRADLVAGMQRLLRDYTCAFNRRHRTSGELFTRRYHSKVVDGHGAGWLSEMCDYVHVHPGRSGLLQPAQPLRDHPWSSLHSYLKPAAERPDWLHTERVFRQHCLDGDTAAGRAELERRLEEARVSRWKYQFRGIERGWYFGDESFMTALLNHRAECAARRLPEGTPRASGDEKARRIVQEQLDKLGWTATDLPRHPKGDPRKIRIARRLRAETVVPLEWIARELHMGPETMSSTA